MLEIHRGISWRAVRSWIGEHVGVLLVVGVTVYLVGFFLYQALAPVQALLWQETASYTVGDSCRLLLEYPSRILLEPSTESGHPITARLWVISTAPSGPVSPSAGCSANQEPVSYMVQLGPLGKGLEFTDDKGGPAPAVIPIDLALTESAVTPGRLYIRRAPSANLAPVVLDVRVQAMDAQGASTFLNTIPEGPSSPVIRPESERASRWRHLLDVFFNPGPLQWLFAAVAGFVGVWQVYKDFQQRQEDRREKNAERRRAQRERIEALRDAVPSERAFRAYRSLLAEFKDDRDVLDELRNAFNPGWLPYLRQLLGRYLCAGQFDEARKHVEDLAREWRHAAGERTLLAIQVLIQHLGKPEASSSRQVLQQILAGFRAVGLGATQPVVDWLAKVQPDLDAVHEVLFREGGAGGRYLLLRWGERNEQIRHLRREWEQEASPLLYHSAGVMALWARERGESLIVQQGVQRLGLDFNPFGPEKAEQDPNLPDLFYRLSPVWEEVTAPQPSILIAPPGCGRSAFIWMIRYESGLIGSAVENVYPVFVPLYSCASAQELAQTLQASIAAALCRTLALDPYALLGLEEAEQRGLADLLLHSAGGLAPLLQQLHGAGLSPDDPDGQLLQEALAFVARSRETWEGAVSWDIPRFHPYGMEHTFLLVDVCFQDLDMTNTLLECLFSRWLPTWAPRHLVPKVFLATGPESYPLTPVPVEWVEGSLSRLLRYRLQRAGLVLQSDRPALDGWVEEMEDPDRVLVERAEGSPAQLIRLGNRLVRRLAQPQPLAAGEFLEIVSAGTKDEH